MQIVIDIPERYFESIKDFNYTIIGRCRGKTIQYQVINAIRNGTPLTEIVKRIEKVRDNDKNAGEYPYNRCIEIIKEVMG